MIQKIIELKPSDIYNRMLRMAEKLRQERNMYTTLTSPEAV